MGETYKSSKRFDSGKKEEVLYEGKGHRKGVIRFVCFVWVRGYFNMFIERGKEINRSSQRKK
jgi:hypothetical protein